MKKIALITGATSGIGLETAKELLKKGFFIIGTGRDIAKCTLTEKILNESYSGSVKYFTADQSDLRQVKELADSVKEYLRSINCDYIDVLINNAGSYVSKFTLNKQGLETLFVTNYLSAFLLTNLLMPLLENSNDARVLSVSSCSHYHTKINWQDLSLRKHYFGFFAYKQSKLAIAMFTNELNSRYKSSKFHAISVDPGLVNTSIAQKSTKGITKCFWAIRKKFGVSIQDGAKTSIFLASENLPENINYYYFYMCKEKKPSKYSLYNNDNKRLWELSENLCKDFLKDIYYC